MVAAIDVNIDFYVEETESLIKRYHMSISEEYRRIYDELMVCKSKGIIMKFNVLASTYHFQPFCHSFDVDCIEKLSSLLRNNLTFYCYGEEEIVNQYNSGTLYNLDMAARYSYSQRLPKRNPTQDGLPGELLLDLLIQIYQQDTYKLAVRPLFRQDDNFEIKGYDLTYFTKSGEGISLWLGQAKTGTETYCKTDIHSDLMGKFTDDYLSGKLYFICDKPAELTSEAKSLMDIINTINRINFDKSKEDKAKALFDCFKENNVKIKIPCLMAYDKGSVYSDVSVAFQNIENETAAMHKYFAKHKYQFGAFSPEILFYIFPIKDLEKFRSDNGGFYSGLRK